MAKKAIKKPASKEISQEHASRDGWPTPAEFERGWWTRDPKIPTFWELTFAHDRMRRDQAGDY